MSCWNSCWIWLSSNSDLVAKEKQVFAAETKVFDLTDVWKFYYIRLRHQRIERWEILLWLTASRKSPMPMESIVNIRGYYSIVDVGEQLIVTLGNKSHWLYVLQKILNVGKLFEDEILPISSTEYSAIERFFKSFPLAILVELLNVVGDAISMAMNQMLISRWIYLF